MPGQIKVQTPALATAAAMIGDVAGICQSAGGDMKDAAGQSGAFGGEKVGAAFESLCEYGDWDVKALGAQVKDLSRNVALASIGYVKTDRGIIPVEDLQRFGNFAP